MKRSSTKAKNTLREQQHIEQKLKLCQAKLQVLLDNVSSGVAVYCAINDGSDFVFVDFNQAAEEIEQIKKEDVIGRCVTDVFPGVKDFGLLDVFRRVWKTGTAEQHPVSVYSDDRIAGWRQNRVYRLPSGEIVAIYDDVTQNERSELAARMSEQCFRAIADYTYGWEVWVAPTGRVLWTNPAVHRVTGYTPKELNAMLDYPAPLMHEDDRDRICRAFQSALRGGTGNDVQFKLQRKDGTVIWAEMSWQPIFDEKGISLGHRQSIRDITAHRQAERAFEKAELEKETILDCLTEHVVYQSKNMTIIWANRAACESAGMSREHLIGRNCYHIWAQRDEPCESCPVVRAMQTGRIEKGERLTPDGKAWLIQGSPVRDEQGNITGAVEVTLDITQRKIN